MPELTITSPFVHSRVDNRFTMSMEQPYATVDLNTMPESTLSPRQGIWICPLAINRVLRSPESPQGHAEAVCLKIGEKLAEKSPVRKAGFLPMFVGNG
jgi:hypothetical protein